MDGKRRLAPNKAVQLSLPHRSEKFIMQTSDPSGKKQYPSLIVQPYRVDYLNI